jgi:hypothetical protein
MLTEAQKLQIGELYSKRRKTYKQIAKKAKCTVNQVEYLLRTKGLQNRPY